MDEKYKLYRNIIFILLVLLFHYSSQKRLHYKQQHNILKKPLYDIMHNFLGEFRNDSYNKIFCTGRFALADTLSTVVSNFVIIYLIYYKKIKIISDSVFSLAILFLLRSICFSLTTLPTPKNCKQPPFYTGGCGDLMFSGHYIWFTIALYIIIKKTKIDILLKSFFVILFIISIISTLMCKNHYSIDIFISILISYIISLLIIK